MVMTMKLTPDELKAAREWISECYWPDLDDADELSDREIERGIARHFDGGIAAFKATFL